MDSDPDINVSPEPQLSEEELRLSYLSLEDSRNVPEGVRLERNCSLPADFYDAREDIKSDDVEASPPHMVTVGREGSSKGKIGLIEGLEMDGESPPSPSSSGYAGERGSSGGSSGIGEEVDGGGRVLHDDWDKGKRRIDEKFGNQSEKRVTFGRNAAANCAEICCCLTILGSHHSCPGCAPAVQVAVQRNSSRLPADQPVWRPSWAILISQIAAHNIKEVLVRHPLPPRTSNQTPEPGDGELSPKLLSS
ncbi:hypothetical protein M5K25_010125 [Dendrobium thyrsiflorum]|uniref:Uncharacterized protein n=1 Tax=Dendrobium thyrsiflorum TaxID=117978 RepID=A0ABD0UZK0_DENTH